MRKVNEYSKYISLWIIFENYLWEKKKKINFYLLAIFFYESSVKIFINKLFINNLFDGTH